MLICTYTSRARDYYIELKRKHGINASCKRRGGSGRGNARTQCHPPLFDIRYRRATLPLVLHNEPKERPAVQSEKFVAIYKIRSGILNLSDLFYTHDNSYLLVRSCPQVYKVEKDKLLYKNRKEVWVEVGTNKSHQMEILQASHTAGHQGRIKTYSDTTAWDIQKCYAVCKSKVCSGL